MNILLFQKMFKSFIDSYVSERKLQGKLHGLKINNSSFSNDNELQHQYLNGQLDQEEDENRRRSNARRQSQTRVQLRRAPAIALATSLCQPYLEFSLGDR